MDHHHWMRRALELAKRGAHTTHPNPRVGCVLVGEAGVVGEGWHRAAGQPHAEINALRAAGERARGATAYVTLEPCCHHGRTGPCCKALIEAGVTRVVAAAGDPFEHVAGGGFAALKGAGVEVLSGVLEAEARALNAGFFSRIERGRPWVRVKLAASLDGRTALPNGDSQWITGAAAREDVQQWRARASLIMTGAGTLSSDDPRLNVRIATERQPIRLVVGDRGLHPGRRLFEAGGPVWLATDSDAAVDAATVAKCDRVITLDRDPQGLDMPGLLRRLAEVEINEVHVEAGARLCGTLLSAGLVDELVLYLAPCLLGRGRSLFDLPILESMSDRINLEIVEWRTVGDDLRVIARIKRADSMASNRNQTNAESGV